MTNYENYNAYFQSWAEELTSRANRVRMLIGERHWLTDGQHKEVIVKEFLSRYISAPFTIGGGFVKSRDGKACSPEIDILISACSGNAPYFNEGGVQILPPSSVVAYIEMKSTFTASALNKALAAIQKTQDVLHDNKKPIWRCICFAHVGNDFNSFTNSIEKAIQKMIGEYQHNEVDVVANIFPTCITSFSAFVVFIKADKSKNLINLNFFDFGKLSPPTIANP